MRYPIIIKMAAFCLLGLMMACQTNNQTAGNASNQTTKVANNSNQPENKAAANTNQLEDTNSANTKTEVNKSSTGSTASPTEAYKTAYAARQKKDIPTLKKVLSKDMLEFFELMTEDGKTIDDSLMGLAEKPQGKSDETRNEKINGDKATLEYLDEQGKWKTMDFVKEGGDWKLTIADMKSPDGANTGKKTK